MKTAVEWLAEQMLWNEFHNPYLEQAKEMEKEQKKELVIATYTYLKMKNNKLPYGMKYLNKLSKLEEEAEEYYNQTFKQQEQ